MFHITSLWHFVFFVPTGPRSGTAPRRQFAALLAERRRNNIFVIGKFQWLFILQVLRHDSLPNGDGILGFRVVHRCRRIAIPRPDARKGIGRTADEPAILLVVCRAGFTKHFPTGDRRPAAAALRTGDYAVEQVMHNR